MNTEEARLEGSARLEALKASVGRQIKPLTAAVDSWGISANLSIELSDTLNLVSITGYREGELYFPGSGNRRMTAVMKKIV